MINREFSLSDQSYARIASIAYSTTGIKLPDHKRQMVYSRLARRLRQLNLSSFEEYCRLIEEKHHPEQKEFVNAITTNLTSFFRERHHFDLLKGSLLKELEIFHSRDRRIRIWSAGCSTGEEPYSIAMELREHFTSLAGWDITSCHE